LFGNKSLFSNPVEQVSTTCGLQ